MQRLCAFLTQSKYAMLLENSIMVSTNALPVIDTVRASQYLLNTEYFSKSPSQPSDRQAPPDLCLPNPHAGSVPAPMTREAFVLL
jgi:hypothetical protein